MDAQASVSGTSHGGDQPANPYIDSTCTPMTTERAVAEANTKACHILAICVEAYAYDTLGALIREARISMLAVGSLRDRGRRVTRCTSVRTMKQQ